MTITEYVEAVSLPLSVCQPSSHESDGGAKLPPAALPSSVSTGWWVLLCDVTQSPHDGENYPHTSTPGHCQNCVGKNYFQMSFLSVISNKCLNIYRINGSGHTSVVREKKGGKASLGTDYLPS